jgi:haloalkane dehalogenase
MGDSEKLPASGPNRYTYDEQRSFLWALWEELGLKTNVVLVVHDWGPPWGLIGQTTIATASRALPTWIRRG